MSTPDSKHLLLTWAMAGPVVGALGRVAVYSALDSKGVARGGPGPQTGRLFVTLMFVFHWFFTAGSVLCALILTMRRVDGSKRTLAWVAAAVALLCSVYIASATRW